MGLFDSIKKLFSSSGKKDSHNKRLSERIEHKKRVEQRYSEQEIIKDPYEKDQNSKTEQVETKSIRYKISDFREEFRSNITAVPENFMLIFFDAVAKGEEFIDVPVSVLKIAQENIKKIKNGIIHIIPLCRIAQLDRKQKKMEIPIKL